MDHPAFMLLRRRKRLLWPRVRRWMRRRMQQRMRRRHDLDHPAFMLLRRRKRLFLLTACAFKKTAGSDHHSLVFQPWLPLCRGTGGPKKLPPPLLFFPLFWFSFFLAHSSSISYTAFPSITKRLPIVYAPSMDNRQISPATLTIYAKRSSIAKISIKQ